MNKQLDKELKSISNIIMREIEIGQNKPTYDPMLRGLWFSYDLIQRRIWDNRKIEN